MKARSLLLLVPLLLASCLKDDLDLATLNTNPLDRGYEGPPVVVLEEEATMVNPVPGVPDTVYRQTVRVREDLLPPHTTWTWRVKDLGTNEVTDHDGGSPTLTMTRHHAVLGTTYCYEYTLMVQYVGIRPYRYCGVAVQ